MKKCSKCNRWLPEENFYKYEKTKDGLTCRCKECCSKYRRKWYQANREYCLKERRDYYVAHRKHEIEQRKGYNKKVKLQVFKKYSDGKIKCSCCGENFFEFLTIDHIDGGGTKHRKKIGSGNTFYRWLKTNGYPKGYRVLCYNCNQSLGHYNYCPHQRKSLYDT